MFGRRRQLCGLTRPSASSYKPFFHTHDMSLERSQPSSPFLSPLLWPRMPSFAVLTSLLLLAASDLVVAQINAPDCSLTWNWSFNSLGQDPCTVAAYLMSTCNNGAFTISALAPGYSYTGPTVLQGTNLCICNTVVYNLLSACDACQGATWIPWTQYETNCTATMPPSTFPNPVPSGTRVPRWALMDDTGSTLSLWDATTALTVGDSPEVLAGSVIGPGASTATAIPGASTASRASSGSATSGVSQPGNSSKSKSSSNTGAIAGGVAGGVVVLAIIGAVLFYFMRKRQTTQAPSAEFVVDAAAPLQPQMDQLPPQQPSDQGTLSSYIPSSPLRLYDPNDPTTYPGFQSAPTTPDPPTMSAVSYEGSLGGNIANPNPLPGNTFSGNTANPPKSLNGNTLASMQTAHAPVQGYHGLPTV